MNDAWRAAILAFAQSVFPVLQIFNLVDLTGDQVAAIMLAIASGLTLAALAFKKGQQEDPDVTIKRLERKLPDGR